MTTTTNPSTNPIAATGALHPRGRLPGTLVVAGFATFLVVVVVLHVVQHDKDPRHNWVSDYANGRGGWLLTIAFLGAATGLFGLALGINRCVRPSRPRTVAIVAFAIASLATVASGVCASDPPRADGTVGYTTVGAIHDLSGLVGGLAVLVGLFALARACRRDPAWERTAGIVRLFAVLFVVGLITEIVIGELSTVGPDGDGVTGVAQRIDLAITMTGAILLGLRLYNSPRYADLHTDGAAA
ncbi:MAG: DUF998 domain-containing protein [Jiangellaceae bacterium]